MSDQYSSLRAKTRKRGWRGKVDEFIFKLEQGEFDPKLELDATVAPTANGTPANKPEGGTQESNGDHNGDVDMMNEDAKEDEMDIDVKPIIKPDPDAPMQVDKGPSMKVSSSVLHFGPRIR